MTLWRDAKLSGNNWKLPVAISSVDGFVTFPSVLDWQQTILLFREEFGRIAKSGNIGYVATVTKAESVW